MAKYVALLRGVNVGGTNPTKMSDLKVCFEAAGFKDVRTYINSGNVLFEAPEGNAEKLTAKVEKILGESFAHKPRALVCSHEQLAAIVKNASKGFGTQPDKYYSDAIFLLPPLTVKEAMEVVQLREGVDQVWQGNGVLYFARLGARRVQSKLSKIVGTPAYKSMTIRSWTTVTKLLKLLDG